MDGIMTASAPRRSCHRRLEGALSFPPRPAESHDLLTDPVVPAHVDPSLPSGRLLGPRCGNPSSGTVLVLRGHRDVAGFAQFKIPHRGNLAHMWGTMWGVTRSVLRPRNCRT